MPSCTRWTGCQPWDRGLGLIEEAGARGRDAFIAATGPAGRDSDHIATHRRPVRVEVPDLRPLVDSRQRDLGRLTRHNRPVG